MKCAKAEILINEYVDGLLDQDQKRKVMEHIDNCPSCETLLKDLQLIVQNAGELEVYEVPETVWHQIEHRLDIQKQQRFVFRWKTIRFPGEYSPFAPVFSAIVLLLAVFMMTRLIFESPAGNNMNTYEQADIKHQMNESEREYLLAIEEIKQALENQATRFPPELESVFMKNLKIIDDAISACKKAVHEQPENLVTGNYLMLCYKKKYDILYEMRELSSVSEQ